MDVIAQKGRLYSVQILTSASPPVRDSGVKKKPFLFFGMNECTSKLIVFII